jgi:FliP family
MALAAWLLLLTADAALAQTQVGFPPGNPGGGASDRIIQIFVLISALSLLPALFITMTSFTRFIVALSFLRSGLGLQNTPANMVMIVLSVFMTAFVMSPTFERAWRDGVSPLMENRISEPEAFEKVTSAFRDFMLAQVRDKDLKLFADLAKEERPRRDRSAHSGPRLHDFRTQARLRDGLSHRHPVSHHRHGCRHCRDVDGHDDDAALGHRSAAESAVLHFDRRLEPARRQPCAVLHLTRGRAPGGRPPQISRRINVCALISCLG